MLGKIIAEIFGWNKDNKETANSQRLDYNSEKEAGTIFDEINEQKAGGINGKIDESVSQGSLGDCWIISGALSMSYTEDGSQAIKDSISQNSNGNIEVTFDGIGKTYTVTEEELNKNNKSENNVSSKYSTGDDDMLAIELAVEKVIEDSSIKTKYDMNGGNPYYLYKLYGADEVTLANSKSEINDAFNHYEENAQDCSMSLGVVDKSVCGLKEDHAYTIKEIKEDNVKVVDPWNTSEEINVSKKELLNNSDNLSVVYAEFSN